ncbi:MAG: cell division protein FtsQ/DivIB [Nannocystaceae bacterium]
MLAGGLYLVDAHGAPFKRLEEGERGALPVITGIDRAQLEEDRERALARIRRALAVGEAYREKPRPEIGEIHVGESGEIVLYTAALAAQLRLGRGPVEPALARLDALLAALDGREDSLSVVHLDVEASPEDDARDRVIASFLTPADEAAALGLEAPDAEERAAAPHEAEEREPVKKSSLADNSGKTNEGAATAAQGPSHTPWSAGRERRIPRYE